MEGVDTWREGCDVDLRNTGLRSKEERLFLYHATHAVVYAAPHPARHAATTLKVDNSMSRVGKKSKMLFRIMWRMDKFLHLFAKYSWSLLQKTIHIVHSRPPTSWALLRSCPLLCTVFAYVHSQGCRFRIAGLLIARSSALSEDELLDLLGVSCL